MLCLWITGINTPQPIRSANVKFRNNPKKPDAFDQEPLDKAETKRERRRQKRRAIEAQNKACTPLEGE